MNLIINPDMSIYRTVRSDSYADFLSNKITDPREEANMKVNSDVEYDLVIGVYAIRPRKAIIEKPMRKYVKGFRSFRFSKLMFFNYCSRFFAESYSSRVPLKQ